MYSLTPSFCVLHASNTILLTVPMSAHMSEQGVSLVDATATFFFLASFHIYQKIPDTFQAAYFRV